MCKGPEEAVLGEVKEQRGGGRVSRGWITSDHVGHAGSLALSKMGATKGFSKGATGPALPVRRLTLTFGI